MSMLGLIGRGIQGGASAFSDQFKGDIEKNQKIDVVRQMAEIQEQMQLRQEERSVTSRRAEETYQAGPVRTAQLTAQQLALGQGANANRGLLAQGTADADAKVREAGAPGRLAAEAEARTKAGLDSESTASQARKNAAALGADKDALAGISAEARAKHIESAGSLAQAALAKLQMEGAKDLQTLQKALAAARESGDEDAIQKAQQKITDKAFTGRETGKAYAAYTANQVRLIDLESKIEANPMMTPAQKANITSEIAELRQVSKRALLDLGAKMPAATKQPITAADIAAYMKATGKTRDEAMTEVAKTRDISGVEWPDAPNAPAKQGGILGSVSGALNKGAEFGYQMEDIRKKMRDGQALTADEQAIAQKHSIR